MPRVFVTALVGFVALFVLPGCLFGGDDDDPSPTATATAGETATATTRPVATATPDRLATPPASQLDARRWLETAMKSSSYDPPCPEKIQTYGVGCATGDVDGDGLPELAYLVPVKIPGTQLPHPSAVFVRGGRSQKLEEFALDLTADSSLIGLSFFGLEDRTGDGRAELSYLANACGATTCTTTAVVKSWDGTAWRDLAPGDAGVSNVDAAGWVGRGADTEFTLHGGKLPANAPVEAGPSRASTTTFALEGSRFVVESVVRDAPEYLYQALLDAEEIFATDKSASVPAFEGLLNRDDLKDWKSKPGQKDRRPAIEGFALFRILLVAAVQQRDAATITAAIDRVVLESRKPGFEPLFPNLAEVFRKNYNPTDGVVGACAAVNLYLSQPAAGGADNGAYVEQLFDYGYTNPPGREWVARICPF